MIGFSVKISAVKEQSMSGVGISTTARKFVRGHVPETAHMKNVELNERIAKEFLSGEVYHRFKLRSGEIAEIRKTGNLYYIAVVRGRGTSGHRYDIILIQSAIKEVTQEMRKKRLEPGWGA